MLNKNKIFGPIMNGYTFQESGNFFMDNIIYFHNLVLCLLFFILILVTWFLVSTLLYFGNPVIFHKIYKIFYFYIKFLYKYLLFFYIVCLPYYYIIFKICVIEIYNLYSHIPYMVRSKRKYFKKISQMDFILSKIKWFFTFILNFINFIKIGKYFIKHPKYSDYVMAEYNPFTIYNNNYESCFFFSEDINFVKSGDSFREHIKNLNDFSNLSLSDFLKSYGIEYRYYFYSDVKLEFIWTLFPSIILLLLAIPSFALLFSIEKISAPEITIKVVGHQWYWEYQYVDYIKFHEVILNHNSNENFVYNNKLDDSYILESYMINDEDLEKGQYRLLEVDKKLVLPINTSIRLLITSDDVLHSWAVPSLGIKVDACPGRINELVMKIRDIGIYYGQCSELCGWYHGFMPIVIQSLNRDDFKYWAASQFLDIKYFKYQPITYIYLKNFNLNFDFFIDKIIFEFFKNENFKNKLLQREILNHEIFSNEIFFSKAVNLKILNGYENNNLYRDIKKMNII